MFDKPVINVGYNPKSVETSELSYADYYEFDHYKPVVDSGAVQVARSPEEMRALLSSCLDDPSSRADKRKRLIGHMFGNILDGRSGESVVETLLRLA